jgi:hypothetical protein
MATLPASAADWVDVELAKQAHDCCCCCWVFHTQELQLAHQLFCCRRGVCLRTSQRAAGARQEVICAAAMAAARLLGLLGLALTAASAGLGLLCSQGLGRHTQLGGIVGEEAQLQGHKEVCSKQGESTTRAQHPALKQSTDAFLRSYKLNVDGRGPAVMQGDQQKVSWKGN